MKKLLLILSLCLILVPATFSQAMINIDSVTVEPPNPTATDPVYLHIYGWCGYGAALDGPPAVVNAGFTHTVNACYIVNVLAVITDIHDSVYLFTGPAGVHSVYYNIMQNSDQFTPVCDTQVTSGGETVNVMTTSINPNEQGQFSVSWNVDDHALAYNLPDKKSRTISVYSTNGQLISKTQTNGSSGKISLDATAGLYIVTLEDKNGIVLRKKIYCQ